MLEFILLNEDTDVEYGLFSLKFDNIDEYYDFIDESDEVAEFRKYLEDKYECQIEIIGDDDGVVGFSFCDIYEEDEIIEFVTEWENFFEKYGYLVQ